jgi:hypothetical protein
VVGFIIGALAGGIAAAVFHVPFDVATYQQIGRVFALTVCFPPGVAWGFIVLRMALKKKYKAFRIALVSLEVPPA